jgi:hypothetical protein
MSSDGVSRRHFFFGALMAGAVPAAGFGSVPSLRALGYKPFYDKLNPRSKDYVLPPQLLTRSPGHMLDWVRACKGGDPSCSDISISAPYAEWLTLAVIAFRVPGKLEGDARNQRFTNSPAANQYVKPVFRSVGS